MKPIYRAWPSTGQRARSRLAAIGLLTVVIFAGSAALPKSAEARTTCYPNSWCYNDVTKKWSQAPSTGGTTPTGSTATPSGGSAPEPVSQVIGFRGELASNFAVPSAGTAVTPLFDSSKGGTRFEFGGARTSDGTFTAPVGGIYSVRYCAKVDGIEPGTGYVHLSLKTDAGTNLGEAISHLPSDAIKLRQITGCIQQDLNLPSGYRLTPQVVVKGLEHLKEGVLSVSRSGSFFSATLLARVP